jgi:hypothetical protein
MRFRDMVLVAFVVAAPLGCSRADPECPRRVQRLRAWLAEIDWSMVTVRPQFDYARVPIGRGQQIMGPRSWGHVPETVAVDGTSVEVRDEAQPPGASLRDWMVRRVQNVYGTLIRERDPDKPLYLLATANTHLSIVSMIVHTLQPLAVVQLAVRPVRSQVRPWPPSKKNDNAFRHATQRNPYETDGRWVFRSTALGAAVADGCDEAVMLARNSAMFGYERLQRVPEAFERCGCRGDMDTLAAIYWEQSVQPRMKPIRWFPWDEALVQQLGEDATYAELVAAIQAKLAAAGARNGGH